MSGSEDEEYAYDSDGDEDEASQASDIEATNSGDEVFLLCQMFDACIC
jgi:hypothetical protein